MVLQKKELNKYAVDFLLKIPTGEISIYKDPKGLYRLPGWAIQNPETIQRMFITWKYITDSDIFGLFSYNEFKDSIGSIIPVKGCNVCSDQSGKDVDDKGIVRIPILISVPLKTKPILTIKHYKQSDGTIEWIHPREIIKLNDKKQIYLNYFQKMIKSCN